jgi:hypothetical protein
LVRKVGEEDVDKNYSRVKAEVKEIVIKEMERILGDAALAGFVVRRER